MIGIRDDNNVHLNKVVLNNIIIMVFMLIIQNYIHILLGAANRNNSVVTKNVQCISILLNTGPIIVYPSPSLMVGSRRLRPRHLPQIVRMLEVIPCLTLILWSYCMIGVEVA